MAHFQEEHLLRKDDVNCSKYVSKSVVGPDAFHKFSTGLQAFLFPFYLPTGMYREKLPLFLKSFLRSFSPCHKTTKETTSKTTYWTRKQRCLGLQEQPKDPQIKLENLQPEKLKCLQQEHSKSLQLKQGCIKEP